MTWLGSDRSLEAGGEDVFIEQCVFALKIL